MNKLIIGAILLSSLCVAMEYKESPCDIKNIEQNVAKLLGHTITLPKVEESLDLKAIVQQELAREKKKVSRLKKILAQKEEELKEVDTIMSNLNDKEGSKQGK